MWAFYYCRDIKDDPKVRKQIIHPEKKVPKKIIIQKPIINSEKKKVFKEIIVGNKIKNLKISVLIYED